MKNFTSVLVVIALMMGFSACDNMTVTTGDGSEKVQGNGVMTNQDRDLSGFSRIELEGVFNVFLTQGNEEKVKIQAEENIMPLILTSVEGNVLKVKMKDNTSINKMKKVNVNITFKEISEIRSEGVGMLNSVTPLKFRDLLLSTKGVGATRLELQADKLNVRSEIVGALFLKGKVKEVTIEHKGVGALEAFDLQTEKMTLVTEGVGNAEVNATEELNVKTEGLGGVQYKGDPKVKHITAHGLGKVVAAH